MANISNNNIAQAIYLSLKDKSHTEQDAVFKNIVSFLSRNKLISKSKDILSRLQKIINKDEGVVEVVVSSKHKLQDDNKRELINKLKKVYGEREFILNEKLDDKLLGGLKIEIGDELIDLTLKNRLYKLEEHLIRSYE